MTPQQNHIRCVTEPRPSGSASQLPLAHPLLEPPNTCDALPNGRGSVLIFATPVTLPHGRGSVLIFATPVTLPHGRGSVSIFLGASHSAILIFYLEALLPDFHFIL